MYSVYKITNLVNGKMYFGSSNDCERRWREHKSNSNNINSSAYDYPLQRAFRKYGIENFLFENVKNDFLSRLDAENFEHEMIEKYQTTGHQGYNQTSNTHNALSDDEIRNLLKNNIVAINIETEEKLYFDSVTEAAKYFQTDRGSISKCAHGDTRYSKVKNNIFRYVDKNKNILEPEHLTSNTVLEKYNNENPLINGERHSISEWCQIYNISRVSYYKRLKKGMDVVEALTTPKGK